MSFMVRLVSKFMIPSYLLLFICPGAFGQSESTNSDNKFHSVSSTPSEISVDGSLSESAWHNAETISLDYEIYPELNGKPAVQTQSFVTYDQQNLYVAFRAQTPNPDDIRAHFMDRDQTEKMRRDDHVGFTIDPFNTGQWAYRFRINALGIQADAIYNDQTGQADYSWDTIWESEGKQTPEGYVVEVRIPFNSISMPSDSVQNWRFRAYRSHPRNVRHEMISHRLNIDQQSKLGQFHTLRGFQNPSNGLNLELNPTLTANRTDRQSASGSRLENGSVSVDPGFNLNWGIKPNMNLAATVNPDFSQIEADALRFRQNERFVISFPEKRPFFLEGSEIFDTPLNAVFTRSIIEPVGGLKFTGKQQGHTYGAIVTRDRKNRVLFPANGSSDQALLSEPTYSQVFRYRNRLNETTTLGVMAEGRQAQDSQYRNYVVGIDGFKQLGQSNTVRFQYLRSQTKYPTDISDQYNQPASTFFGDALSINYNHSSEQWLASTDFESLSSDFRNDNGFFPRANYRSYNASLRRIIRGGKSNWLSRLQFGPTYSLTTSQSGLVTDQTIDFSATYNGPWQSEVFASIDWNNIRFEERLYKGLRSQQIFFRTQLGGILSKFRIYTSYGEAVDFTNQRQTYELIIHPSFNLNLGKSLSIELDPNFKRLSHNGKPVFSTYLLGTQFVYHFNKKLFLRATTRYRYVDRNLSTFEQPSQFEYSSEQVYYQLLFLYKLNPQSKLFLGYSSGYDSINERPLSIQRRSGFLKVGYAWVF